MYLLYYLLAVCNYVYSTIRNILSYLTHGRITPTTNSSFINYYLASYLDFMDNVFNFIKNTLFNIFNIDEKLLNNVRRSKLFKVLNFFSAYNLILFLKYPYRMLKYICLILHLYFSYQLNFKRKDALILKNNNKLNTKVISNWLVYVITITKYLLNNIGVLFISVVIAILGLYYFMYARLLPVNKSTFEFFILFNFVYLLISGFVFFYKKYQFNRYTTSIQRFWRRSYILFWLIESSLFVVFLYLVFNTPEEPFYMYDQLKIYKTHLLSWRNFLLTAAPIVLLIILTYTLMLSLRWFTFSTIKIYILLITLIILILLVGEFYQFYYILQFYTNLNFNYDYDDNIWVLETEFRRTRILNNVFTICLIAKFWHLVFIAAFWLFFVLRAFETKRIHYLGLSANLQNFIILYIMTWVYMYPWFKFVGRKFLYFTYNTLTLDDRNLAISLFFKGIHEYTMTFCAYRLRLLCPWMLYKNYMPAFRQCPFFYWNEESPLTGYNNYKKYVIRDFIINKLYISNYI